MTLTGPEDRQQLETYAQATADSTGAATFKFPFVPQSLAWVGNVTIPGAPYSSLIVASVGIVTWGVWTGPLPFGPILATSGLQLIVTASGLQAGQAYTATWLGVSDLAANVGAVMPAPSAASAAALPVAPIISTFNEAGSANIYNSKVFQVSNVRGARYRIVNNRNEPLFVQLTWAPSASSITAAQVQGAITGLSIPPVQASAATFRNIVVPAQGFASFTYPHLGDWFSVLAQSAAGLALNFNLVVSNIATDRVSWSGLIHNGPPDCLLDAAAVPIATNAIATIATSLDVYAGPATWSIVVAPASSWVANLLATDTANNARIVARMTSDQSTGGYSVRISAPPAPLACQIQNKTATTQSFSTELVAEPWQD